MSIHNELARTRPDLLEPFYAGYPYHLGGEEQAGKAPVTPHPAPIFSYR